MEVMISNGIRFSIEFIKIIVVVVFLFNLRVKKGITFVFAISLIGVVVVSYWYDISKYSIIYGLLIVVLFFWTLYEKRNIGFVLLSFVGVSIVDMLFGIACIKIFSITYQQMQEESMLVAAVNSISLIPLIIISFLINRKERHQEQRGTVYYSGLLLGGGLAVSVYLTCTQLINLKNLYLEYQNGLVISSLAITIVYSLICYLLVRNKAKNRYLQMENDMNQRLLKAQKDYYTMMLKKETETKMFRHDMKGHIICMQMLYEQKKYEELGIYLRQMESYTKELSPKVVTGNLYIDIIVADLSEGFPEVVVEWIGKVPPLCMESMDICTLFYNVLKNAIESANKVQEKTVKVFVKNHGRNLLITISNYYESLKQDDNFRYLSTKQEKGHGYGLKNIEKCIKRYEGTHTITTENGIFCTEMILPNVITEGNCLYGI